VLIEFKRRKLADPSKKLFGGRGIRIFTVSARARRFSAETMLQRVLANWPSSSPVELELLSGVIVVS
jgi:hypothetical protein